PGPATEHALAGHHPITFAHGQLDLGRKEDVHPGAELHQADPLAAGELVAGLDPGDHPAGHQADDLPEDVAPLLAAHGPGHRDLAALVLEGALELVGRQPAARSVLHRLHGAAVRSTVDVHVEDREKDAD